VSVVIAASLVKPVVGAPYGSLTVVLLSLSRDRLSYAA
jgi:hypothetical protein